MQKSWSSTLVLGTLAVTFASVGLASTTLDPAARPVLTTALMLGSLGCTAAAFTMIALRVRTLELENEGLIEELSQEFDRMKDKLEIFGEALVAPTSLTPEDVTAQNEAVRRVVVK